MSSIPCRATNSRLQFTQISELEVISAINNLENKTSYGCDGMSNKLLQLIKIEISKPITLIVNQCLTTGIFLTDFKIAKVKPIYKKSNKFDLNNYRTVYITLYNVYLKKKQRKTFI